MCVNIFGVWYRGQPICDGVKGEGQPAERPASVPTQTVGRKPSATLVLLRQCLLRCAGLLLFALSCSASSSRPCVSSVRPIAARDSAAFVSDFAVLCPRSTALQAASAASSNRPSSRRGMLRLLHASGNVESRSSARLYATTAS